eukprot:6272137-Amphidinium_carterae.2
MDVATQVTLMNLSDATRSSSEFMSASMRPCKQEPTAKAKATHHHSSDGRGPVVCQHISSANSQTHASNTIKLVTPELDS